MTETDTTTRTGRSRPYRQRARARKTEATRDRIYDAAYPLLTTMPYDEVTLAMIAEAAGVSVPTVLRHVGSKENLLLTGIHRWGPLEESHRVVDPGDVRGVAHVLAKRYEEIGPHTPRMYVLSDRFPELQAVITRARSGHAEWLAEVFADSLPKRDGPVRRRRIAQLFAATEIMAWMGWRETLGLSVADAERALADSLQALVDSWNPSNPTRKGTRS